MPEQKLTLIFIPLPVISHLLSTIKLAKLLTDLDHRLSVTVLLLNLQSDNKITSYTKNSPNSRIKFIQLERDESKSDEPPIKSPKYPIVQFVDSQKGVVRAAAAAIAAGPEPVKISGIVVDILCASMIDVAADLGVPSYVFFTCGAAILGLMFHLQEMMDGRDSKSLAEYVDSDAEIHVSTYVNPVPARVWPSSVFGGTAAGFLDLTRKLRDATGIIVNTFLELEPHAVAAFGGDRRIPAIYPVGPLLHDEEEPADDGARRRRSEILGWLDEQPDSSVVFLCFGSNGCFNEDQVAEIAAALGRSGQRFLWSLRKAAAEGPTEYEDLGEVLPEGFLDRTRGPSAVGKVIGWAPQMAVLAHRAVGGFVSHCGWNSILESVSCGVPMAVWPMFAEQQANAFQLVRELEIAVEIRMDYRRNTNMIVNADEIEKGIRELMDPDNKIRINVNGLREKSRSALMEGGSSYNFVHRLIENVVQN